MNKTLTINLSGLVFHIDENAYEVLRSYLERLKRRFTGASGEEIITDIESRIAEMFQEKISPAKNVITLDDVNSVISVMGNPEDIAGEETEQPKQEASSAFSTGKVRRRLYRNPDDKMLGGVCGGIGAYLDIDPVWFRLAFALAVIFAGSGILLYIILWIVIPMAKTASEKLEMRGEAVNVSNIEKNIRAEMEGVKERLNNLGEKIGSPENQRRVMNGAEKVGSFIKEILAAILRFIGVLVGFVITVFSILMLIFLTIAVFSVLGWIPGPAIGFRPEHISYIVNMSALWVIIMGALLLIGIPLLILLLNGIKLLFRIKMDLKKVGFVMLILWLVGISLCVWQGIYIYRQFRIQVNYSKTEQLPSFRNKVIHIGANKISNNSYGPDDDDNIFKLNNGNLLSFTDRSDSVMCNSVHFKVEQSSNDSIYIVRMYSSLGISTEEARDLASRIRYNFNYTDSTLVLNNAFNLWHERKYRRQSVHLTLKVPIGYKLIIDKSLNDIAYEVYNLSNVTNEDMEGRTFLMMPEGLRCIDCKPEDKNN